MQIIYASPQPLNEESVVDTDFQVLKIKARDLGRVKLVPTPAEAPGVEESAEVALLVQYLEVWNSQSDTASKDVFRN